ncbi:MAG: UDP-N-acetylglucosamine 2-epimerase (non-hydrolyzing) [Magnetococcales bacterium]|nr:UDP-N-acetylglucosamine 2-epimerase (non-hydrolyzing) [Magnetococcales bacterium]MBF0321399.1 UDP-N-acetylglucosamine 2-epimerase (non-hydrolyzing) [Magnetococcales bacterium]
MKMAAILPALQQPPTPLPVRLVHTGQHYDAAMKEAFFQQLGIPEPDDDLGVGSGSHAVQTATIMQRFEPIIDRWQPRAVLVVGDVNSTLACALVASKKGVPVIHVEAGLRSFDRSMPEEINRILTDQIADWLFTTERTAHEHLQREGIPPERIHFVGNVMIDTLRRMLPQVPQAAAVIRKWPGGDRIPISPSPGRKGAYGVVTLHRPSNVDHPENLEQLLICLREVSQQLPLIFPLHPRTAQQMQTAGLLKQQHHQHILTTPPLGYMDMLSLLSQAHLVLTDSGGIQEETTALGVPCLTLRDNTERPVTVTQGTNTLVGTQPAHILAAVAKIMSEGGKRGRLPELWDGQAAGRIATILKKHFGP